MQTFTAGDVAIIESPIFITSTGVQDHDRFEPVLDRPRPTVGDRFIVESVSTYAASGEHVATEDGWVVAAEGLIHEGDLDYLAAQRAPLAAGDRVAVMSTIYNAGTVWEHSSDGTDMQVGDEGVVHEATPDVFGDLYVRMDKDGEVRPISREGLAPVEADVIAFPVAVGDLVEGESRYGLGTLRGTVLSYEKVGESHFLGGETRDVVRVRTQEPSGNPGLRHLWADTVVPVSEMDEAIDALRESLSADDLHEDEVEAVAQQDAEEADAKFAPFGDPSDWRAQFAAYAYAVPRIYTVGTTATDRERALRVASDVWAAFVNATDGGETSEETVEPYDDAEAIVVLAGFLTGR